MTQRPILLAFAIVLLASCESKREYTGAVQDTVTRSQDTLIGGVSREREDYALVADSVAIPLRAWENEVRLERLLGKPLSDSSTMLGEGADTHIGAVIRTIKYEGLVLELYTPKEKQIGWIMRMRATDRKYATSRGATTGESASRIKQLYPEGSVFPDGRNDTKRYAWFISDAGNNSTLKFEIESDTVRQIDVY
ncbi:MAG TPA: hypothetical protein VFH43_07645, partial [Candidatus Kapabacteria bacterium]|nr:hypothetical protein [Candidatus Kapabacteria bacterium]